MATLYKDPIVLTVREHFTSDFCRSAKVQYSCCLTAPATKVALSFLDFFGDLCSYSMKLRGEHINEQSPFFLDTRDDEFIVAHGTTAILGFELEAGRPYEYYPAKRLICLRCLRKIKEASHKEVLFAPFTDMADTSTAACHRFKPGNGEDTLKETLSRLAQGSTFKMLGGLSEV